ncbi:hypothetical protein FRB96_002104 [Tulasnella sp. 330]|nr:hypothetical protein FRB96_002104 [Tulasnella sp. 330]
MSLSTPSYSLHQPITLDYDVLLDIFWNLREEDFYPNLRSVGLVCQAWHDPAMDVLWASTNLVLLLKVLSPLDNKGRYGSLDLFLEAKSFGERGVVHDSRMTSDFFTQMGRLCPNLRELRLGSERIGVDLITIASKTIGQLWCLESVNLSSYDNNDISTILLNMAELPTLESLHLDSLIDFPSQWPQPTATPFPKLKGLCIKRPSISGTALFLQNLATTGSHLTELELGEEYGNGIQNPKEMMILAGGQEQLRSLVMYNSQDRGPLFINTIEPILRCRPLTNLKLDLGGRMGLTDNDIETLASNLTKLEHLALPSGVPKSSPSPTLRALSIAVALWPCFKTLALTIDVRQPVPLENTTPTSLHINAFGEVNVGCSEISLETDDVAYFIARLSDTECFSILSHSKPAPRWDAVNKSLSAMRLKRAREKV